MIKLNIDAWGITGYIVPGENKYRILALQVARVSKLTINYGH
jgi:hypothetical protein